MSVTTLLPVLRQSAVAEEQTPPSGAALAASITRAASKQTYYTIRFLVDKGRVANAYRTYAYFRWVDDWLDQTTSERAERLAFICRQQALMNACYQDTPLAEVSPQEQMLVDLIHSDQEPNSGLQSYIRNMMAVMRFDAERRGQPVSGRELDQYTRWLATAVTEAMHYFIGHNAASPQGTTRYLAVSAAHITHMLRDTCEDVAAGYYNIPREYLERHGITPTDTDSAAYRAWVKRRVQHARFYFALGRDYLAQVQSRRCRIAGYAYMARFEGVLDAIEREHYVLRSDYGQCKRLDTARGAVRGMLSLLFSS